MSAVRTEQVKLTATYMNGLAIALFAVGVLAPLFSTIYGSADRSGNIGLILGFVFCLLASIALHLSARRFLKRLEP